LIIIQIVFLTVDTIPSVFEDPRDKAWGTSASDYGLLILFLIYTLEIIAHVIVSGFIINPDDRESTEPKKSFVQKVLDKSNSLRSPRKCTSVRSLRGRTPPPPQPSLL